MMWKSVLALVLPTMLGGCWSSETKCGDPSAQAAVEDALKNGFEELIIENSNGPAGEKLLGLAKIRAHVADLKISLQDVRTEKQDPNSTKKFCAASLRIVVQEEQMRRASEAPKLLKLEDVTDFMAKRSIERGPDSLSTDISYSVQPTDDGQKVFAEIDDFKAQLSGISQLLGSALFAPRIKEQVLQMQEAEALAKREMEDALNQKRRVELEEATTLRKMSMDAINALWAALEPETRRRLLPEQRVWIRKHIAECKVEALQAYENVTERKAAQYRCEKRATDQRSNQLKRYLSYSPNYRRERW